MQRRRSGRRPMRRGPYICTGAVLSARVGQHPLIPPPLACPRPAAVRSAAPHGKAGNRPERFLAVSSVCAIRDVRVSAAGVCRDGRRSTWALLAAGAPGFERRLISRRAEPDAGRGPAGRGATVGRGSKPYNVDSIFSITLPAEASISSIFDGSLPPASAKSGRPPPLPPTIGANCLTT